MGPEYRQLQQLVKGESLHTVCQEAGCPNIFECWEDREATFLIGGSQCTRRCDFCQIDTGKPADYDRDEPRRVAESVTVKMNLRYATVTGVARDDLPDEGAWLHAETVRQIHQHNPGTGVEILATDFSGNPDLLGVVFESGPRCSRTTWRRSPASSSASGPAFRYERSLDVLTQARAAGLITKSNLILGMGEEPAEVIQALQDLHDAGTDIITITQYLRPTPRHLPVARWVKPQEFVEFSAAGRGDRLPGSARRAARAFELPGRPTMGPVDGGEGPRHPRAPHAPRGQEPGVRPSCLTGSRILNEWHALPPQRRSRRKNLAA